MPDKIATKIYNTERANETLKAENALLRQRVRSLTKKIERARKFRAIAEEDYKDAVAEIKHLEQEAEEKLNEETEADNSGTMGSGEEQKEPIDNTDQTEVKTEETRPAEGQQEQEENYEAGDSCEE